MNKKWLLGGGLLGLLIVAGGIWFVFFKDDAPDEVSNDAANTQLDADLAAEADEPEPAPEEVPVDEPDDEPAEEPVEPVDPAPVEGVDGVWIVNDEIGEFDFDTASGSFAGFRVAEELAVIGDGVAVGRSGGVTGSVRIADGSLTGADITVDMNTIVSNESRREGAIRRAVNASEFPTAVFVFSDAVDVSAIEVGGDAQSFTVGGELTVNGVTNPVTFEIEANVRDDGFGIITGNTEIVWEDFGVTPPSAPVVVSVADEGVVEFQLVVERG